MHSLQNIMEVARSLKTSFCKEKFCLARSSYDSGTERKTNPQHSKVNPTLKHELVIQPESISNLQQLICSCLLLLLALRAALILSSSQGSSCLASRGVLPTRVSQGLRLPDFTKILVQKSTPAICDFFITITFKQIFYKFYHSKVCLLF